MNYFYMFIFFFVLAAIFTLFLSSSSKIEKQKLYFDKIKTMEQVVGLFPKTQQEIENIVNKAIERCLADLNKIYEISGEDRNFENTAKILDLALGRFSIVLRILYVLTYVSPDKQIRDSAQQGVIKLKNFLIDNYSQNKKIYNALLEVQKNCVDQLNECERYFLNETIKELKKGGLEKEEFIRNQIKDLQKELSILELQFLQNISQDNRQIKVKPNELTGIDQDFINQLSKTEDGLVILGIDYPTVFKILQECSNCEVRKALWKEFNSRGYPANEKVLKKVISLRDKIAKLLDYESYAELDISDQMAVSVNKVEEFLNNLISKCSKKAECEIELLKKDLPQGVELENGKLKPWDIKFALEYHKKKYLSLDEKLVSEYFPLDYTLSKLFEIYEKFFGLKFEFKNVKGLWHPDVKVAAVYKDEKFLGTLLLDLFPRDNKYSHACQIAIVPTIKTKELDFFPSVVLVIANFPRPSSDNPSLLKRKDVITFFHECGHAIHSLLGSTQLMSHSGTSVKGDFVEMPSQMLENWMWDSEILKMVSSHYKTNKPLEDDLIKKIQVLKNYCIGLDKLGQIFYALVSLNYFKNGDEKDVRDIWRQLYCKLVQYVSFDDANVGYCSFNHLMGYGPKYYGYLWSEVFAADLFEKIKEHGLLNNEIGEEYIKNVISKGGSCDPYELIKNFLGREPSSNAFFKDLDL